MAKSKNILHFYHSLCMQIVRDCAFPRNLKIMYQDKSRRNYVHEFACREKDLLSILNFAHLHTLCGVDLACIVLKRFVPNASQRFTCSEEMHFVKLLWSRMYHENNWTPFLTQTTLRIMPFSWPSDLCLTKWVLIPPRSRLMWWK